jgi:hypothetical protein
MANIDGGRIRLVVSLVVARDDVNRPSIKYGSSLSECRQSPVRPRASDPCSTVITT